MFAACRQLLQRLAPDTVGQLRGIRGKTLRKGPWEGWPNKSPDGWYYARYLKGLAKKRGQAYETKQERARRLGIAKGKLGMALFDKQSEEPMYVVTPPPSSSQQ